MSNKYLTPKQILDKYGINTSKTYWWVHEHKLVYIKIGKSVLIPEKELLRFLESNTLRPISEDDYVVPEEIL